MNDTEQLIKEALNRQADRAPHPGPTLSALRRPARKRTRSSIFLTVGVAAAAAAVLFAAGVIVGKAPRPDDGAAALMPTGTQNAPTQLKYSPGWVPDGFVEAERIVTKDGISRTWTSVPDRLKDAGWEDVPMVTLTVGAPAPQGLDTWQKVQVGGVEGHAHVGDIPQQGPIANVVWSAPDALRVIVRGVPDVRAAALRVAENVRADGKASVESAIEYRGMSVPKVTGKSPSEWTSEITFDPFIARVSSRAPDLTGGRPMQVRGEQGTLVPGYQPMVAVFVDGVWLTVTGTQLPDAQLVAFANEVKINPKPDYSWLGSRP